MFRISTATFLLLAPLAAASAVFAAPGDDLEGITPPEGQAEGGVDISEQIDPTRRIVSTTPDRPVSNDPGEEWLGRTANAPAEDPPEVAQAKAKGEEVFEKFYRTADPGVLGLYAVNPIVKRSTFTPEGGQKSIVVPQLDVRDFLRRQFTEDKKRLPKEISYSMPWYRVEGKNVRVHSVRSESNPHRVYDVVLLIGPQVGDKWVIIEDSWSQANKN